MEILQRKLRSETIFRFFFQLQNLQCTQIIFEVIGGILLDGLIDLGECSGIGDAVAVPELVHFRRGPAFVVDTHVRAGVETQQEEVGLEEQVAKRQQMWDSLIECSEGYTEFDDEFVRQIIQKITVEDADTIRIQFRDSDVVLEQGLQ